MKKIVFLIGLSLIIVATSKPLGWAVDQTVLVIYAGLLLIAFWDDIAEFDFLGLKGKKIDKKLEELAKTVDKSDKTTNEDMLTKIRKKKVQLLGVDKSNFLALVFEIERILRIIVAKFDIKEQLNFEQMVDKLHELDYLTDAGQNQLEALNEIRDLIIQSGMKESEVAKLDDWLTLAYDIYQDVGEGLAETK